MVNYNRLVHILNRNTVPERKYSDLEIKNCFAKTSYNGATCRL